jgi:hypothetical protein
MRRLYNVWLIDRHGDKRKHIDLVRSKSKDEAEELCYLRYGYSDNTEWSRIYFEAEQV